VINNLKDNICESDKKNPTGRGFCPSVEKINTVRIGKDNNAWIIKEMPNKKKKWVLLSKDYTKQIGFRNKISLNDRYLKNTSSEDQKFILKLTNNDKLFKILNKQGIKISIYIWSEIELSEEPEPYILGNPRKETDWYWNDAWDAIEEKFTLDESFIIIPIYLDTIQKKYLIFDNMHQLRYNFVNKTQENEAYDTFKKIFKDYFYWSKKDTDPFLIFRSPMVRNEKNSKKKKPTKKSSKKMKPIKKSSNKKKITKENK
jgi:hypothetical protein